MREGQETIQEQAPKEDLHVPGFICKYNARNFETCHGIKVKVDDVSVAFTNETGASRTFMSKYINKLRIDLKLEIPFYFNFVLNARGMNLKQNLLSIIIILLLK